MIPLSIINSKTFSINFYNALLFLIEETLIVFVNFSEVFFIASVNGSNTFFYILVKIFFTKFIL